ncbi:hypothetical protein HDU84_002717 [Entophlyctis sp. JEL0112]|nr:hypothetical protein HDU84_002717 [Entophlyctis sp. JEL0112]
MHPLLTASAATAPFHRDRVHVGGIRTLASKKSKKLPGLSHPRRVSDGTSNSSNDRDTADATAEHCERGVALTSLPFRFEAVVHEETKHIKVASLAHGLERVFPGVHYLKDPRTGVFNFSEALETVTQPEDFNYESLPPYKIASNDPVLKSLAKEQKQKYYSSTSSITHLLAQVYQCISDQRPINKGVLSLAFAEEKANFTTIQRKPTSAILKYYDGVYSIDQEKEEGVSPSNGILMNLGKSMEKLLTASTEEYIKHLKNSDLPENYEFPVEEAFHYANIEGFLLRSQLDCHDDRLPKKTFDLKTRATVVVRMDPENYKDNTDYTLSRLEGIISSFEREYYDMARSAMLKYNLQVRIGNMDGIFVCYHNTQTIFGFQYISREEMNRLLFGSCAFGDAAFALSVKLLERVVEAATAAYPARDVRLTMRLADRRGSGGSLVDGLVVFVEPADVPEGSAALTKLRVRVLENSLRLLDTPDAHKFDPKNWVVEVAVETAAHADAPLSTAFGEEENGVFVGEVAGASENPSRANGTGKLYEEYARMRQNVAGLNRKERRGGMESVVNRLKSQAQRAQSANYSVKY